MLQKCKSNLSSCLVDLSSPMISFQGDIDATKLALDSWMKIRDGHLSLMMKLQFEEPWGQTDTDKITKLILGLNPRVRGLNVAYGDQASLECPEEFKER